MPKTKPKTETKTLAQLRAEKARDIRALAREIVKQFPGSEADALPAAINAAGAIVAMEWQAQLQQRYLDRITLAMGMPSLFAAPKPKRKPRKK